MKTLKINSIHDMEPGRMALICKTNPEWGLFGVRGIQDGYVEAGRRVIFEHELVEHWEIYCWTGRGEN